MAFQTSDSVLSEFFCQTFFPTDTCEEQKVDAHGALFILFLFFSLLYSLHPDVHHVDALTRTFYEVCEDAVRDGVRYIEIRFSPILHTNEGLSLSQVMEVCERLLWLFWLLCFDNTIFFSFPFFIFYNFF